MFWRVKFTSLTLSLYLTSLVLALALWGLVIYQFLSIERIQGFDLTDKPELVSLKRLQQDWLTLPYQEIELRAGSHCRAGWETLFSWRWDGTRSFCLAEAGNIDKDDGWTPETKM